MSGKKYLGVTLVYRLSRGLTSDLLKRDLPTEPGAREKLFRWGLDCLSESELLSLILGKGSVGAPVGALSEELSKLIFEVDGSTHVPSMEECLKIKGLGKAKASSILAALELGKRSVSLRGRPILEPEDALAHLSFLSRCQREHFYVLYLDSRRRLLEARTISVGTLDSSLVHPREVFRPAIELSASAILAAHNHPSGDPEPSAEDIALTRRLNSAAKMLGFYLLDHIIIGGSDWVSVRQRECDGHSKVNIFAA